MFKYILLMSKNMTDDEKNKDMCKDCTMCCEYVTVELSTPEDKEDVDEIIWFMMHDNVFVYIDHEDTWNIEFKTKCKQLGEDGLCNIYTERPDTCRNHHHDECEKYGEGEFYKVMFKTKEEVLDWISKNTKIEM